ncbi:MAG: CBS and ACT domain-containing protein [Anaerolineae bacterium]
MLVRERMTKHVLTVKPNAPVDETLRRMRLEKVRRFPVVDNEGRLVGIVSERDLLYAAPSPATSLSVYELHYLYSRIKVEQVMTRDVVTVNYDDPIEEAARLMVDHRIGGLPVIREGALVGIITETDIFKAFMEMLGARDQGIRITVSCHDKRGELAAITSAIARLGGNIISLSTFWGEDAVTSYITLKVSDVDKETLINEIKPLVIEIVDVREM